MVVFFYMLLFSEKIEFQETGNNIFHIYVNDVKVGVLDNEERAREMVMEARKEVAAAREELTFLEVEMNSVGEEVLWGEVDSEKKVYDAILQVVEDAVMETMHRAYTVKVNEYVANLGSIDEVKALLQAAIDRYDAEKKFEVQLYQDTEREFGVLGAEIVRRVGSAQNENVIFPEAGFEAKLTEIIEASKPVQEKDFDEYEQGVLMMEFPEKVEVVESYLPASRLDNLEETIAQVTKEQELISTYEVVAGDTLTEIAIKVDIPMEQIVEMNHDILDDINSILHIGDQLVITVPEPELSVIRQEESYIEETYELDIQYIDNDKWYTNQSKVIQQPFAGYRKIIAVSTYENDRLVNREIVKEEVVVEAVPKIVERGTKVPPSYIKPINGGRLSSPFGKRTAPVAGASTYHKAVDWAIPTGTSVVASCGGTVARAGWGSGYGYVVYINHEDGRQTRYAHLSKILVKVGQKVKQGERIALSGSTGVSSGPHIHFEILIGGKQVDPMKYINK